METSTFKFAFELNYSLILKKLKVTLYIFSHWSTGMHHDTFFHFLCLNCFEVTALSLLNKMVVSVSKLNSPEEETAAMSTSL